MKSIGMSKIGLVRQRNEDRFYIGDSFCIVTDGMGGYKGGEIASTMVVDTLAADMQRWQDVSADALRQAVAKANMAVYDSGRHGYDRCCRICDRFRFILGQCRG